MALSACFSPAVVVGSSTKELNRGGRQRRLITRPIPHFPSSLSLSPLPPLPPPPALLPYGPQVPFSYLPHLYSPVLDTTRTHLLEGRHSPPVTRVTASLPYSLPRLYIAYIHSHTLPPTTCHGCLSGPRDLRPCHHVPAACPRGLIERTAWRRTWRRRKTCRGST